MAHSQTVRSIAKGWIKKGDNEKNLFNRFIAYWVAFNCFYNAWTEKEVDAHAIDTLCKDVMIAQSFKSIINISNISLFNQLQSVCPIRKVSDPNKFKTISSITNFKQVVLALYQIRCNLVHGGKGEEIKRDKEVVKAGVPVLELIVKKLVSNHF